MVGMVWAKRSSTGTLAPKLEGLLTPSSMSDSRRGKEERWLSMIQ